jgi:hypothetical protein
MYPQTPPKYEPAEVTFARILQDLGLDNGDQAGNQSMWIRWIFEAQLEANVPVQFSRETERFQIENCIVPMPRSLVQPVSLEIHDDYDCRGLFAVPVITKQKKESDLYSVVLRPDQFIFSSNANGKTLKLEYTSYLFSDDGLPFVDQTYYRTVLSYCRYKWTVRKRTNNPASVSPSEEQLMFQDFMRSKISSKSKDFYQQMTANMLQQVMAQINDGFRSNTNPYVNLEQVRSNIWASQGTSYLSA